MLAYLLEIWHHENLEYFGRNINVYFQKNFFSVLRVWNFGVWKLKNAPLFLCSRQFLKKMIIKFEQSKHLKKQNNVIPFPPYWSFIHICAELWIGSTFESMHVFTVLFTQEMFHLAGMILLWCLVYSSSVNLFGSIYFLNFIIIILFYLFIFLFFNSFLNF